MIENTNEGFNQKPLAVINTGNRDIYCFTTQIDNGNIDHSVVHSFGEEWKKFSNFSDAEIDKLGKTYFDILDEKIINKNTYAIDIGCGTGRFTKYLVDKIGFMEMVDPSDAIIAANQLIGKSENVRLSKASTDNLPFNDETALKNYFQTKGSDVSAIIIEGIQGVGGINIATDSFLQLIRRLCDQNNAVYIADSVQCGYGRSGKFFSHDYAGVDADIYTMAKGMGNGFPVGAVLIAPHIKAKHGMLGTTFGGNHLACAAALAVLEIIEQENLIEQSRQRGMYLLNRLKAIDGIENVRGRGLMIGFDVPDDIKDLRKKLLTDYFIFTGEAKPNVIRLLPSLCISKKQVDEFLDTLKEAIAEMKTEKTVEA